MARVLYFAALAEQLGTRSEELELPADCATADDLARLLRARGEPWASAFAGGTRILVAVNQQMCAPDTAIANGDEIAFFPPVTGG